MKLLIQWVISVIAIAITVRIVPGISIVGEEWKGLAIAAVMLGLANLLIRPVLALITAPITAVTLGLFWFVIGGIEMVSPARSVRVSPLSRMLRVPLFTVKFSANSS